MHNNKKTGPWPFPACLALLSILAFPPVIQAAPAARDFLANDLTAANQIIVRLRPHTLITQSVHSHVSRLAGVHLTWRRTMGNGALIYQLPASTPLSYVRRMSARIAQDSSVLYAEPNTRVHLSRPLLSTAVRSLHRLASPPTPNDPLFPQQWSLSGAAGSINAPAAWQITTGASNIVIAIVDTGARFDHEDLQGRLIAGPDMVTHSMNPVDPGVNDNGQFIYHGTGIAGVIGAATNNGIGVAGINWVSKMLVVRVMDNTGNTTVGRAVDGMRWAAGLPVPGYPMNPTPARVINYSAGEQASCSRTEMDAINEIRAKGAVVVVAPGNDNLDGSTNSPSNCPGVISVAAIDSNANRASFSDFGASITVGAPGVNITLPGSLVSPFNSKDYIAGDGTSFAAPMVSGVVSLMLSVNPGLSPDNIIRLLKQSARPFPPGVNCSGICQAGMLDAGKAVALAAGQGGAPAHSPTGSQPQALHVLISRAQTVRTGTRVRLIGIGRPAPGTRIASYLWRQVSGPAVQLSNAHVSQPSFLAPRAPATLVFHLTVTDSRRRTIGAATTVRVVVPGNASGPQPGKTPAPSAPTTGRPGTIQLPGGFQPFQMPNLGSFPIQFPTINGQPLVKQGG